MFDYYLNTSVFNKYYYRNVAGSLQFCDNSASTHTHTYIRTHAIQFPGQQYYAYYEFTVRAQVNCMRATNAKKPKPNITMAVNLWKPIFLPRFQLFRGLGCVPGSRKKVV